MDNGDGVAEGEHYYVVDVVNQRLCRQVIVIKSNYSIFYCDLADAIESWGRSDGASKAAISTMLLSV